MLSSQRWNELKYAEGETLPNPSHPVVDHLGYSAVLLHRLYPGPHTRSSFISPNRNPQPITHHIPADIHHFQHAHMDAASLSYKHTDHPDYDALAIPYPVLHMDSVEHPASNSHLGTHLHERADQHLSPDSSTDIAAHIYITSTNRNTVHSRNPRNSQPRSEPQLIF